MDFWRTPLVELARRVKTREVSARELVGVALSRIDAVDGLVNAFVAVDPERALDDAAAVDARVAAGDADELGPLAGVPLAVKDLEEAAGYPTSYGSAVLATDDPAPADSLLVARLRAAGCVVVGKTNTPELGWQADTVNPLFGRTHNPWNLEYSPGGSSGGSAAAIAAGMVPLATGSDGGGSIRIPAAVCGLAGMKPSLGRVPLGGPEPPGWPGLSVKAPMARRVRDLALALDCVVGPDPTDQYSLPMPEASWTRSVADVHAPVKVGWSPTLGYAPLDAEVRAVCEAALRRLAEQGTEVVEVPVVFDEDPVVPFLSMMHTFSLRTLGPYRDSPAWDRVDPALATLLDWAAGSVSAVDLVRAMDTCHRLNVRLVEALRKVHLLVTPTTAGLPPRADGLGTIDGNEDPNWVRFTYPFNMTRSPAGTVPVGFTASGLPVGLQVVGPPHADVAVLRLLALLEDLCPVEAAPLLDGLG